VLLPTGTGEHKTIQTSGLAPEQAAAWLPDSGTVVYSATESGHRTRLYVQGVDSSKGKAITPEGIVVALPGFAVSPDGKWVAAIQADRKCVLFPVDGGAPRPVAGVEPGEFPLRFSPDGRSLYVWKRGEIPAKVTRVEVETGKREVFKSLIPADPAGIERISNVVVTPDGKGYAYCYTRLLSDLFVVEGLR
jgi:hypothetical protein